MKILELCPIESINLCHFIITTKALNQIIKLISKQNIKKLEIDPIKIEDLRDFFILNLLIHKNAKILKSLGFCIDFRILDLSFKNFPNLMKEYDLEYVFEENVNFDSNIMKSKILFGF